MRAHLSTAVFVLSLAACSTSKSSVAPVVPSFELPAEVLVVPPTWETAGSEIAPRLVVIDGPEDEALRFEFEYEGAGKVSVPKALVLPAGSDEIECGSFASQAPEEAGEGLVQVYVVDQRRGQRFPVAEWPILHRPSIIEGLSYTRVRPMADGQLYSCLVSVNYDAMEGHMQAPGDRDEWLEVTATVQKQDRFAPETHVTHDVTPDMFPEVDPRSFRFDGERKVVFVTVSQPSFPPTRRAYLEVVASIAGDRQKVFIPLPNR